MKKKNISKEDRIFNKLMNNVSYTFGAYALGTFADFLIKAIILLVSLPFDTLENTRLIYNMDTFADKLGNVFYHIGIFFSIVFFIRCVFLYKAYTKETKKLVNN